MTRPMRIMLTSVGILFAVIFAYKAFVGYIIKRSMSGKVSIVSVSSTKVGYLPWQSKIKAAGSVRAIRGVNVTSELAGMVQKIYFTPGAFVQEGNLLVQLNIDPDVAQLHALQANADIAKITYNRDQKQYAIHAISKQVLDTDAANLKNANALVDQQKGNIAKKTIRAPFTGRLGICIVSPGQYINPGDKVVTLESFDPIYVDFYVPQQAIALLSVGQSVVVTADSYPDKTFSGKITTIDPLLDTGTRNVEVEVTVDNPKAELTPGMFTYVEIDVGKPQNFLTLPQTAISFNPYGDVVFIVQHDGIDKNGKPILTVKQSLVTTGETRGDQITILNGLKEGDEVVTSGQLKLKNGSRVSINNSLVPANNPAPTLADEH